jgi:hypothetical protein
MLAISFRTCYNVCKKGDGKMRKLLGLLTLLFLAIVLVGCGGRDPHGLNGVWEHSNPQSDNFQELSFVLEFSGNNITQHDRFIYSQEARGHRTTQLVTAHTFGDWIRDLYGNAISEAHFIDSGWVEGRNEMWGRDWYYVPGYYWMNYEYTLMFEAVSFGTFTIADDGRIEIIWDSSGQRLRRQRLGATGWHETMVFADDRGVQALSFERTDNTISIGGLGTYVRVGVR